MNNTCTNPIKSVLFDEGSNNTKMMLDELVNTMENVNISLTTTEEQKIQNNTKSSNVNINSINTKTMNEEHKNIIEDVIVEARTSIAIPQKPEQNNPIYIGNNVNQSIETHCKKETILRELYKYIIYITNSYDMTCKMKAQNTFYNRVLQEFKVLEKQLNKT